MSATEPRISGTYVLRQLQSHEPDYVLRQLQSHESVLHQEEKKIKEYEVKVGEGEDQELKKTERNRSSLFTKKS